MTKLVELLINGVSLGFIYSLIALGFVIIYKSTEVVNFAHGSLLLLGGYVTARLVGRFGFSLAFLVGLLITAVVALIIERLLIRPLRRRGADVSAPAILTIGVDILVSTDLARRIGANTFGLHDPWGSSVVHLGGFTVAQARIAAIVVAVVLIALFLLAFKFTSWGIAMRASAEDGEAAALMGIRLGRVSATAWVIGGLLAAIAAIFLTAFPTPGLDRTTGLSALSAFPAAILGGLDSTGGVLLGGLVVGVAQTLTSGYENAVPFLGQGLGSIMPWIVMLLVLLIRPAGLFGTTEATRV
ncbi:MAG: branched-chain amino acid ABC transporter permease [Sciscionella sp.]